MRRYRRWLYPKICRLTDHRWFTYDKAESGAWVLVIKVCLRCGKYKLPDMT